MKNRFRTSCVVDTFPCLPGLSMEGKATINHDGGGVVIPWVTKSIFLGVRCPASALVPVMPDEARVELAHEVHPH
jgi:hypothetical protein